MDCEIKVLTKDYISLMKDVIEDDNMVFNAQHINKFIDDPHNIGFVALIDNKIVGFSYCYDLLTLDDKHMLFIYSVGILPNYQKRGIGTSMIKYIVEYAKNNGFRECFVPTDKGNVPACKVYERNGGKNDYEDEIIYVWNFDDKD